MSFICKVKMSHLLMSKWRYGIEPDYDEFTRIRLTIGIGRSDLQAAEPIRSEYAFRVEPASGYVFV